MFDYTKIANITRATLSLFSEKYRLFRLRFLRFSPFTRITLGFLSYVILGVLALSNPICQNETTRFVDNLFNVVSAISTTGLATVIICEQYTFWGNLVILTLIQLGAIGYMTLTSCLLLARGNPLSYSRTRILGTEFALPEGFNLAQFIVHVLIYTVVVETVGALILWQEFARLGVDNAFWQSVFHSISAFGTAGFSLFPNGLESFRDNFTINAAISGLSLWGAVGFIVPLDIYRRWRCQSSQITFTSQVILSCSAVIILGGTLLYGFCQFAGYPNSADIPGYEPTWSIAFFQVVSASTTAGFNTVPIGTLAPSTLVLLIVIMLIGASPSGTGGGVKTTTITAFTGIVVSVLRGRSDQISFLGRIIPAYRVFTAVAVVALYLLAAFISILSLTITESQEFLPLCFESVSALGTVGLSTGITGNLTDWGKLILVATMFIGRIGPLTLGLSLMYKASVNTNQTTKKTDLVT